jgi:glycosyltransferase involved in cell wall biosynthesis
MENKAPFIYLAGPWGPKGGGMFKVSDYLIQNQASPPPGHAELRHLDTRGNGNALFSLGMLALALAKITAGRLSGRLIGVHVNMAERLSVVRKGLLIGWARLLGLPVVLHLHAAQLHHFYRGLPGPLQSMTRRVFAMASHCLVLGKTSRDFVVNELNVPAEKVEIVINGVPPPTLPRRIRHREDPKRILFLGNLTERKGVSDLLRALATPGLDYNLAVSIAGGGDVAGYTEMAQMLGISHFVRFEGWVDQDKAAELISAADVLVLPSYDEGLPLVILEALANSVAVVCTPVGEIETVLTDGVNAHFVVPGDVGSIASALHRTLSDDGFRHQLEANGHAIYEAQFSINRFFDTIAGVHKSVFGMAASARRQGPALPV